MRIPGEEDRRFLDEAIYGELALGRVRPEVRKRFLDICARHIEHDGIDSVILGCTEIPLVIKPDDVPVVVLDTTAYSCCLHPCSRGFDQLTEFGIGARYGVT